MKRLASRTVQTLLDVCALAVVFVLAYLLRFDWFLPPAEVRKCAVALPYVVALQYGALTVFAVPRFAWRYVGLREAATIFRATLTSTLVLLVVRIAAGLAASTDPRARYALIPTGVILIDFVLGFCAITGLRILRRLWVERRGKLVRREAHVAAVRTLLVGAGAAGVMVAKEIEGRPDLGIEPVGFLDDNPTKIGTIVHGIPTLGTTDQLREVSRKTGAAQVLITAADAPGKAIRRIVKLCEDAELPVKIIPAMHEIVGGRVNLSRVRNVAIEDLLRREAVHLDQHAISAAVRGRVVLVTGAGGSIGSELCRQVCAFAPSLLVLVERAENNLFEIHRELSERYPTVKTAPLIADVCDPRRMTAIFEAHHPSMVFHAAAHKHVPMMEWNPGEAIKNNVLGTRALADLSDQYEVAQFVMVSTDKAVNPASIMGASKRVAEVYIQALAVRSKTRFLTVRFGNVLGSAGSVVPIFKQQIARGGPVTITHPDMKRYFMTIPEASQLVLQAATMGKGGEIFILDMSEPVRIVDLAEDLITLSGLRPGEDIEIQFTGVRPGEKLFEELSVAAEAAEKTHHPKIFVGRGEAPAAWPVLLRQIDALGDAAEQFDAEGIASVVAEIVPEFRRNGAEEAAPPRGSVPRVAPAVLVAATPPR